MEQKYVIFIAIILGALIIGGFTYLAILSLSQNDRGFLMEFEEKSSLPQNSPKFYSITPESSAEKISKCQASEKTIITKVIDGDTVITEGGYHVRLLGIDADEKGYPCYESAKNRLEELVLQKQVILQRDITDVDQYKRCLRTIFIENFSMGSINSPQAGSGQVKNIDLELVKEGLAVARFYEPDVKYKNEIAAAEKQAIENKIGCKWSGLK